LNFIGQVHRWRLSQLLQKGCDRTQDSLLSDLALAARFIVITARGRMFGHFFSVSHALRALWTGFIKLIDMIVGRFIEKRYFCVWLSFYKFPSSLKEFHHCWPKIWIIKSKKNVVNF
jgi:hypothetical protein